MAISEIIVIVVTFFSPNEENSLCNSLFFK